MTPLSTRSCMSNAPAFNHLHHSAMPSTPRVLWLSCVNDPITLGCSDRDAPLPPDGVHPLPHASWDPLCPLCPGAVIRRGSGRCNWETLIGLIYMQNLHGQISFVIQWLVRCHMYYKWIILIAFIFLSFCTDVQSKYLMHIYKDCHYVI